MKTRTEDTFDLEVCQSMSIATVKKLLEETNGTPAHEQRLFSDGELLHDELTLGNYNILKESKIYSVPHARGGMYHFTSGRQDLDMLPDETAAAVRNVLAFEFDKVKRGRASSSAELQTAILKARTVLSKLDKEIENCYILDGIPDVRSRIYSTPLDDSDDTDSDSDDEDALSSNQ